MLFIYDKSTVQGVVKWRIKDKDILSGKKKITYISPGGYTFETKAGNLISFDFSDSGTNIDLEKGIIESELYSLDYEFINFSLKENKLSELIKEEHRLELFKDFKEFNEVNCFTDVDEVDLECIYFELYDPISEEILMLKGEYNE